MNDRTPRPMTCADRIQRALDEIALALAQNITEDELRLRIKYAVMEAVNDTWNHAWDLANGGHDDEATDADRRGE